EPIDLIGFDAPDRFLIGYGMDDAGRYRGLPFIAAL
ncbi:MAG: hypoxanthine phosphoribosyltransferase, partial [Alphaproteobacteria bacterium]|nr:hypoxanthine phosphoribosyltransferase [Alphaproteobacteria bacterium]